jgi:hypothetical protein
VRGLASGRRALLIRAVQNTEWKQLLDFVSPSFFDVMPVRALLSQGRALGRNAAGGSMGRVRDAVQERLDQAGIAVRIDPHGDREASPAPHPPEIRRALGQRALEVYFAQLFTGDETLLDMRFACWSAGDPDAAPTTSSAPVWGPRPLWVRWEPDFRAGLRDVYAGFFGGDDALYTRGTVRLGLGEAGDLLRAHFGSGDQRSVRFDSAVFQTTFHEVFVRCRDEGVVLHRNFLPLGVYLATLYDLLEGLDEAFDVREAFCRAVR